MGSETQVFVNYRRVDADADAQWLASTLKTEFGEDQVFVDVDDIDGGEKLSNVIESAVDSAKVLLTVIGPKWHSATHPKTGELCISREQDWVRQEIEMALRTNTTIIPVLVGGMRGEILTRPLPDSIASLSASKGMVVRPDHRREDQYEIAHRIESLGVEKTGECDYRSLLGERFGDLLAAFKSAPSDIGKRIINFGELIDDRTRTFVGRQFVFDAIDQFIQDNPRGYFLLRGDPGIGKSAMAAHLVQARGYLHHFNVRSAGIVTAKAFLENLCAQVIVRYSLDRELPTDIGTDGTFLELLLREVDASEPIVVVVDALDEVDLKAQADGSNLLYLPRTVPDNIYFVLTSRRLEVLPLSFECERQTFDIDHDSKNNLGDIRLYLERTLGRAGIEDYIQAQNIDPIQFTTTLEQKSEGNFMYLRHVLKDIESGLFRALDFAELPTGLKDYYAQHWRRIRTTDDGAWFDFKLPVLLALSEALESVSIELLMEFSGVSSRSRVRAVLNDWTEFLHRTLRSKGSEREYIYRIYHDSFRDFVAAQEEVEDERIDRQSARRRIAESLWKNRHGSGLSEWLDHKISEERARDSENS